MTTNVTKERKCIKEENEFKLFWRLSKQISVAIEKETYDNIFWSDRDFRIKLNELVERNSETFLETIKYEDNFYGFMRESKKIPGVRRYRIKLKANKEVYKYLSKFSKTLFVTE